MDGTLIGKTVKIKNVALLEFMYPDFIVKDKLFFDNDNKIIYTGKLRNNLKDYLKKNTKEFINTVGPYDIDLDDREILLEFVYSKYGKEPKESVKEVLLNASDEDFYSYIKSYWIIGKSKLDKIDVTIFDLYKNITKPKNEILKILFKLFQHYNPIMIESSIITFIEKAINYSEINASGYYLKILKEFHDKNKNKLKSILLKYNAMDDDIKMKLMWLIMQF